MTNLLALLLSLAAPTADVESYAVAVYYKATCATLGKARGVARGFYVNGRTVASVMHVQGNDDPVFPDYAVVDRNGCHEAQVADNRFREVDLIFLRVHGKKPPPPPLAAKGPLIGERIRIIDLYGILETTAGPLTPNAAKMSDPPIFVAAADMTRSKGGAPVVNRSGEIVGMFMKPIGADDSGRKLAAFLSIGAIRKLLEACGPCEDD